MINPEFDHKYDSAYYKNLEFQIIDHSQRFFDFQRVVKEKASSSMIQSIEEKDIHFQFPIKNNGPNSI